MGSAYSGRPDIVGEATNADIDTAEEDILVVTDIGKLTDTQFSIYVDYALGTNTSLAIRYYVQNEVGGSWYVLPAKNESDGTIDPLPTTIDSSSPASRFCENLEVPACFGFKVTGQGTGGADSSVTVKILSRNN